MSQTAYQEFNNAHEFQLQKNEARKMRTLVEQARGNIERSGARWPFELTQNAHDPGARPGVEQVTIDLSFDGEAVTYQHDGKPFSMQDLAALLSGGSSKEFESRETTGRFGTGFLLTHVLSPQVEFQGILLTAAGYEMVRLQLDRSGTEDAIYANTVACATSIEKATALPQLDSQPTASFRYKTDNPKAAEIGLAAFSNTLPYLYGTCQNLGTVTIRTPGKMLSFRPDILTTSDFMQTVVQERRIAVLENGLQTKAFNIIRILGNVQALSSLLILLEVRAETSSFVQPGDDFPRLFCRFPIRTSHFLPANVVIDGRFDLSQERDSILMKEHDQLQISEALGLLPGLAKLALQKNWHNSHKLARLGMPQVAFGDDLKDPQKSWWHDQLSATALKLADAPIVKTASDSFHKASAPPPTADFIVPAFDVGQPIDELEFGAVWQLATELEDTLPPALEIASDWTKIVKEWAGLGVTTERLALLNLANFARDDATTLKLLKTKTNPLDWLTRFLNLLGEIAPKHNCSQILASLLPDQNEILKSPTALHRDAGIHERLKDISKQIGLDVRARLLLKTLADKATTDGFQLLNDLLASQIQRTLDNAIVIEECLAELTKQLPDAKTIPPTKTDFRDAAIDLLKFLWDILGKAAAPLAQKCPFVASDGTAVRWSAQRRIIAPVSSWHPEARQFASIYKGDRILSEEYIVRFGDSQALTNAMTAWDIGFTDPLCQDSPAELKDERLAAIADSTCNCEDLVIADEKFSQIALLPNELIQRSQSDPKLAKTLLGLAVSYAARVDTSWHQSKLVSGHRNKEQVQVAVCPSLWIADLLSKPWVPIKTEQGLQHVWATAGNLKEMLDHTWLIGNDAGILLLTKFFGFKELDLRLLATAPSPEVRQQLEAGLAKLVEAVGSDPTEYTKLTTAYEVYRQRQREKERNRKFGLAVQAAVQQYLEARRIRAVLVDCGYDFDIHVDNLPSLDAGVHKFKLADYMLEVKATTTGEVRMTPAQTATASDDPHHFILCVVDLRGITQAQMDADWTPADIEPKTKIVTGIGALASQPRALVTQATQCQIGVRNDGQLRYGVSVTTWQAGLAIADWVQTLKLQT